MKTSLGGLAFDLAFARTKDIATVSLVFLRNTGEAPIRSDTIAVALEDASGRLIAWNATSEREFLPEVALSPGGGTAEAWFSFALPSRERIGRVLVGVRRELAAFALPLERESTSEPRIAPRRRARPPS